MHVAEPCACAHCSDGRGWGLCLRLPHERRIVVSHAVDYDWRGGYDENQVAWIREQHPGMVLLPSDRTA